MYLVIYLSNCYNYGGFILSDFYSLKSIHSGADIRSVADAKKRVRAYISEHTELLHGGEFMGFKTLEATEEYAAFLIKVRYSRRR